MNFRVARSLSPMVACSAACSARNLNTPQVGILGMHAIQERAVVVDGEIQVRPMMYIALSYDHRVVDGSTSVSSL